jgi:hypothetical protein
VRLQLAAGALIHAMQVCKSACWVQKAEGLMHLLMIILLGI